MFAKHRRINQRKPNLPGQVFFNLVALKCMLRLNSVGAAHTGDQKENVLEAFGRLARCGGVTDTLTCYRLLSTLLFPLRINSFLFDILNYCPVLFNTDIMKQPLHA